MAQGSFQDKVAVITGAGSGFGAAFSRALAAQGATIALLDINLAAAEAVAAMLPSAFALCCDVGNEAEVERAFAEIANRASGIDILINNAGLHSAAYNKSFGALGLAETRKLFNVNVMGVIQCTLAAHPAMKGRAGAAIVNISSMASYGCKSAYGVSKFTVRGLTLSFAQELASDGIRVNGISPGLIATDVIRADFPEEFFRNYADNLQLVHRTGEIEDIVAAMLYLCSPAGSFMSGETLKVTGGCPAFTA